MKNAYLLPLLLLLSCTGLKTTSNSRSKLHSESNTKIQILVLGTPHLNQLHEEQSIASNFLSQKRQQEIDEVNHLLKDFSPDLIMIEREPKQQAEYDSLLQLFQADKLNLEELDGGAGEVYQFAFKLAKNLGHGTVHCVDYYESTSQGLLTSGDNIQLFEEGLRAFQQTARGVTEDFRKGSMTFREFLAFLNTPETVALSHRQFYNLPAYVQNGSFRSYEGLNKASIDTTKIGAEFISLFYERNLKIYSNILNTQLKYKGNRILLIIGQTHVGVLQDILKNNPDYEVISASQYLQHPEV